MISQVLTRRGWDDVGEQHDFEFVWAQKDEIAVFHEIMAVKNQRFILNHFRQHHLLTRKDQLVQSVQRKLAEMQMKNCATAEQYSVVPLTFIIPQDLAAFEAYGGHDQAPDAKWIVKPASLCQGQGIFITDKAGVMEWVRSKEYSQVIAKRHQKDVELVKMMQLYYEKYGIQESFDELDKRYESGHDLFLVQKYIENPLLINNHKFDCRVFVLVKSFHPTLEAFVSNEGFARFALKKYEGNDLAAHLTNISIQKGQPGYDAALDGAKWSLSRLIAYLQLAKGKRAARKCWQDIGRCIFRCLECVQEQMDENENCFALYGFDVMLTDDLHPFICEVNASPSMVADTAEDELIKKRVLNDVLSIIVDGVPATSKFGVFSRLHFPSEMNQDPEAASELDLLQECRLLNIQ